MMPEDTNLVRAWCKNNAPFPFAGLGNNGVEILMNYQKEVRKTELDRRHDRTRKMVDEVMKEIHPLSQEVLDWVKDEVMKPYRYIFYNYQKGKENPERILLLLQSDGGYPRSQTQRNGNLPSLSQRSHPHCKRKIQGQGGANAGPKSLCLYPAHKGWLVCPVF